MKAFLLFLFSLFLCTTANAQWIEQTSGTTNYIWTISAVDNNVCWMGADGGVVLRTTNGGTSWSNVGGGAIGTNPVYNIFAYDANLALCSTCPGFTTAVVFRTTNGGTTWTQVFSQAGGFMDNIWMFSETNGFLNGDPVGSRWSNWKTTDGGVTWDSTGLYLPQVGNELGYINSIFVIGSTMYFGTDKSRIYQSTTSGTSWSSQLIPLIDSWGIWFNSPSIGLVNSPDNITVTTNGGTTWSIMTIPSGSENILSIIGFGDQWYYCRGNTIIGSTNNGVLWTTSYTAPTGLFSRMTKARNGDVAWACRDDGGITKGTNVSLPVELTSFTATSNGKEVLLNWSTATELNNQLFEVQRSFEGNEFATIGFVNGKGTTTERQDYSYSDKNLSDGKYSYRLKQIDYLGRYEYSDVVEIDYRGFNSYLLEQNYPNPFNPTTTIGFGIKEKSFVKVVILNNIGEEVAIVVNEEMESGFHQVKFTAANLPSGVYFYQLSAGEFTSMKKMILLK